MSNYLPNPEKRITDFTKKYYRIHLFKKILRWTVFIPAFIFYIALAQLLTVKSIEFLNDIAFPVKSFFGLGIAVICWSIIITIIAAYSVGAMFIVKIAPNTKLAGFILMIVMIGFSAIAYIKHFDEISKLRMFLDALYIYVLIYFSFLNKEDNSVIINQ